MKNNELIQLLDETDIGMTIDEYSKKMIQQIKDKKLIVNLDKVLNENEEESGSTYTDS